MNKAIDRLHAKADHLYRVILEGTSSNGITDLDAANYAPVANALKNDYPEVRGSVRITPEYSKVVLSHQDKVFEKQKVYYADSTFFTLLDVRSNKPCDKMGSWVVG